ncbi:M14 family metallopeptidase [Robiginitalea sp. M366]|uniref:M14 family metallopeptidase n=1 Tax=Robiginitalea aestuariiviva TaxID=3036903 RepID=UPI00240DE801|nr:M14 family metallopeptidase [Robiginitalea aestuariiviva]MDG1572670.1 M14 family metallopeptidase [Robiginitalea aestuariiviva]
MKFPKFLFLLALPILLSCKNTKPATPTGYQGQGPTPIVSTRTKPVQRQWRGVWAFQDSTVFFSNTFDGARLNGVAHDGGDQYTLWITAENTPINPSPWYGFQVWSSIPRELKLRFTYDGSRSRYYPKISRDGIYFKGLDSTRYRIINPGEGDFGIKAAPEEIEITVAVDAQPTWITAQELYTSAAVKTWVDSLSQYPFISNYDIGKSREGRPMNLMEVNGGHSKKALMIISRQHPPEVTGFLAMKSFMETLSGDSPQAKAFREEFTIFNVPLMNPDGVDNGHWRHNLGGIDLNRDWQEFNQPETRAVRDFLKQKSEEGYEFVFGADFHSTWDDIYYPIDTLVTGDKGKIVFDWIKGITDRLPQKKTNISTTDKITPTMVSRNHFYVNYGMPAIVFELGDNTPRDFLREKGRVAAEELMRLLMK